MPSDWERVTADPLLLAALRRHYTGSGDPLDRLWWAEHPGEPTPAGVADPSAALEADRRSLFRRDAAATSADAVERAEAADLADRDAARHALAAADAEAPDSPPTGAPASRRPTRAVLAGAVVAALLVGAGVGFAGARFSQSARPAALAVLDRPQRADDRAPSVADVPTFVPRSSTRLLGSSSTTGVAVYGARARDGRLCLVAVVLAARFTATCTTDAGFAAAGLSLSLEATVDPQNDSGFATLQELDPHWSPDGRLTF